MKIGILGSRGIPNQYGGFEQFAEYLATALVARGHEVWVYCSHLHPYQNQTYNGVKLQHCFDAEDKLGTAGQFVYDWNCIRDSRKRGFDILLQLGYTSNSVWRWFLPKQAVVITNMDGMEWMRSKYSAPVQRFLRHAEAWAVRSSDALVADSLGIQQYLLKQYSVQSTYIPYGAEPITPPASPTQLQRLNLEPYGYDLLIARLEPENSLDVILTGFTRAQTERPILIVGNHETPFGKRLKEKFNHRRVHFVGAIYEMPLLNELRYYSNLYFHGHTVGGTNPSLLEAMASHALICAQDNVFNRAILGEDAFYFTSANDVTRMVEAEGKGIKRTAAESTIQANLLKTSKHFAWPQIVDQYEALFLKCLSQARSALIK